MAKKKTIGGAARIRKSGKVGVLISLDPKEHESTKEAAKKAEQSLAGYIRLAIKQRREREQDR